MQVACRCASASHNEQLTGMRHAREEIADADMQSCSSQRTVRVLIVAVIIAFLTSIPLWHC